LNINWVRIHEALYESELASSMRVEESNEWMVWCRSVSRWAVWTSVPDCCPHLAGIVAVYLWFQRESKSFGHWQDYTTCWSCTCYSRICW
jgi:hypothetical protein